MNITRGQSYHQISEIVLICFLSQFWLSAALERPHPSMACRAATLGTSQRVFVSVPVSSVCMVVSITVQLDPGVRGIMHTVSISPDDKYAVTFTNNSQLVMFSISTGQCRVVHRAVETTDGDIVGVTASNGHCVVWTSVGVWRCMPIDVCGGTPDAAETRGRLQAAEEDNVTIVYMAIIDHERYVSFDILRIPPFRETNECAKTEN